MAKKIQQIIYHHPDSVIEEQMQNGSIFNQYMPIINLGIQCINKKEESENKINTYFYLNGNTDDPIYIGYTGIYELDLTNISQISKLQIFPENAGTILVDMVYESED